MTVFWGRWQVEVEGLSWLVDASDQHGDGNLMGSLPGEAGEAAGDWG